MLVLPDHVDGLGLAGVFVLYVTFIRAKTKDPLNNQPWSLAHLQHSSNNRLQFKDSAALA